MSGACYNLGVSDVLRCPICGRALPPETSAPRAFCSERCRTVDLGSWLDGKYRLSTRVDEAEDEASSGSKDEPEKE